MMDGWAAMNSCWHIYMRCREMAAGLRAHAPLYLVYRQGMERL